MKGSLHHRLEPAQKERSPTGPFPPGEEPTKNHEDQINPLSTDFDRFLQFCRFSPIQTGPIPLFVIYTTQTNEGPIPN